MISLVFDVVNHEIDYGPSPDLHNNIIEVTTQAHIQQKFCSFLL